MRLCCRQWTSRLLLLLLLLLPAAALDLPGGAAGGLDIGGLQQSLHDGGVDGLNQMLAAMSSMSSMHGSAMGARIKKDDQGNEMYDFRNIGGTPTTLAPPTPARLPKSLIAPPPASVASPAARPGQPAAAAAAAIAPASGPAAIPGQGALGTAGAVAAPAMPVMPVAMAAGVAGGSQLGGMSQSLEEVRRNVDALLALSTRSQGAVAAPAPTKQDQQLVGRVAALEQENTQLQRQLQMQSARLDSVEAAEVSQERENSRLRARLRVPHPRKHLGHALLHAAGGGHKIRTFVHKKGHQASRAAPSQ